MASSGSLVGDAKFIFVTGGVVSSLGKGIATASIGLILKQMGYRVILKKLDPYLNIDPGTMNPTQHGEVFVTEDGMECDLDLGHYERFTGINTNVDNNITSGKIYQTLIENERKGKYLGATVQTIPHVTNLIKEFIYRKSDMHDFVLCEIGGTVGDIEALPFFESIRQIKQQFKHRTAFIHLTYVPFLESSKEIKTKPTQHSVKELMSIGIVPDILICRSSVKIGKENKRKIALFCNVDESAVIEALDVDNVYSIPIHYAKQGIHRSILSAVGIAAAPQEPDLSKLETLLHSYSHVKKIINIGIAGKYTSYKDSYKSIIEAISHAGMHIGAVPQIHWINTKLLDEKEITSELDGLDCLVIPGGFGVDGTVGKMRVIKYAREQNVPTLGICFGMQLMLIEVAKNILEIKNATSEELDKDGSGEHVIGLISSFEKNGVLERRTKDSNLGGTMRLGRYEAVLRPNSLTAKIYGAESIFERHRHRYEADVKYMEEFSKHGIVFAGLSPDGKLPEIVENKNCKFFIGVQFHPELKSKLLEPHPLFLELLKSAK